MPRSRFPIKIYISIYHLCRDIYGNVKFKNELKDLGLLDMSADKLKMVPLGDKLHRLSVRLFSVKICFDIPWVMYSTLRGIEKGMKVLPDIYSVHCWLYSIQNTLHDTSLLYETMRSDSSIQLPEPTNWIFSANFRFITFISGAHCRIAMTFCVTFGVVLRRSSDNELAALLLFTPWGIYLTNAPTKILYLNSWWLVPQL